jgi:hypothetical protein
VSVVYEADRLRAELAAAGEREAQLTLALRQCLDYLARDEPARRDLRWERDRLMAAIKKLMAKGEA